MANSEKPKNTLVHDTICLFVITLVAGILLGAVYTITEKPIAVQKEKTKQEAYAAVYEDAEFQEDEALTEALEEYNEQLAAGEIVMGDETLSDVTVTEVLRAEVGGAPAGYVLTCSAKGYGGSVSMALGIDGDGAIKGIKITDCSNETPGLGQNSSSADWNGQFLGMNSTQELSVVTNAQGSPEEGTVSAISGATITSKAVTRAVNGALHFVASLSEQEG